MHLQGWITVKFFSAAQLQSFNKRVVHRQSASLNQSTLPLHSQAAVTSGELLIVSARV